MQRHIRKVYACLAVTCHLHFGRMTGFFYVLLRYHGGGTDTEIRVSTESRPWRRKCSRRPLLRGFEPATFQSRVRRSNHWAIPLPPSPPPPTHTPVWVEKVVVGNGNRPQQWPVMSRAAVGAARNRTRWSLSFADLLTSRRLLYWTLDLADILSWTHGLPAAFDTGPKT